jgi:hypothetical protein
MENFLRNAAKYYAGEPHQDEAWEALEASLDDWVLERFKAMYRGQSVPSEPVNEAPPTSKFPLDVPYFYQRDSKTGHGERSCFSSAMAMAIEYLDPEAIDGDDDTYLEQVFRYGDTVSSTAQIKAARSLGMDCDFYTDLSEQDLIDQLDKGIPVPIGILHKGPVDRPTGGGHWICLIGYDEEYFHVHDPFGELNLTGGGYPKAGPTDGENQRYTRKSLMKRFLIASKNDGWGVIFR